MATILDEIVSVRKSRIAEKKQLLSLETLRDSVKIADRDFSAALRSPQPAFILECKRASPSRGMIRKHFDVSEIARAYSRHASAISVLTEPDSFGGDFEHLNQIRGIARQPLLCKDFVFEEWQVFAARYFGADAILLILAVVDDRKWHELFSLAQSLGMAVLTEISNSDEQARAMKLRCPVVGINNRNLRDMSIDLNTTVRLAESFGPEVHVVSESGYGTHQQVRQAARHCDAFLCGSSLMEKDCLEREVKRLVFGDHKVCGLTDKASAVAADEEGAVYGGVIFAKNSPRLVTIDQANEILDATQLVRVGVFLDAPDDEIAETAASVRLDVVQFHGKVTADRVLRLIKACGSGIQIWPAVGSTQFGQIPELLAAGASRIVADSTTADGSGGTGRPIDFSLLPVENRQRIMLAGGMGINNVCEAVDLGVAGIDFNSSLETAPGKKSPERIRELFRHIRQYGRRSP